MIFFEFRDMTGTIQGVVLPGNDALMEIAKTVRNEFVVAVSGIIHARPERNIQADKQNGAIELEIQQIEILNESLPLPFDIGEDTKIVNEETRLTYRYLDLRSKRLQDNIRMRDKIITFFREYMHKHDFVEIETPMMMKGTPEGSREYADPVTATSRKFFMYFRNHHNNLNNCVW